MRCNRVGLTLFLVFLLNRRLWSERPGQGTPWRRWPRWRRDRWPRRGFLRVTYFFVCFALIRQRLALYSAFSLEIILLAHFLALLSCITEFIVHTRSYSTQRTGQRAMGKTILGHRQAVGGAIQKANEDLNVAPQQRERMASGATVVLFSCLAVGAWLWTAMQTGAPLRCCDRRWTFPWSSRFHRRGRCSCQ